MPSTSGSQPTMPSPRWSWSNIDDLAQHTPMSTQQSSTAFPMPSADTADMAETAEMASGSRPDQAPPKPEKHYKPRTCRICLEVVQPSFDLDGSGFLGTKPKVKYVSDDPESGRLISPCKCKGSQRYVHEGCLQAWRQAAPLSDRNFWRCPTCQYEYRMERLRWSRWLSSKVLRVLLTALVFAFSIFILGFVADPIINLWLDPVGTIADTVADVIDDIEAVKDSPNDDEDVTWEDHFLKGIFSLGLLGFLKAFFFMSPWQFWNLRSTGFFGGARRGGTGRDRVQNINLGLVLLGVITFIGAVWKGMSVLSAKALEKVSDRVADVQGDNEDDGEEESTESRKDQ